MTEHAFGKLISGLVKAIHVELSDEAIHFAVAEVAWQHHLLKLAYIFYHEFPT